jgi:hypothetical protein
MKRLYLILVLPVWVLCLASCETTETTSADTQLKTAGSVPGEKTADEPISATANPGGAAGGVRW